MSLASKRVLYISYNGMLEPLGQSQVIRYLRELSKLDIQFTLLSFERAQAFSPEGIAKCAVLQRELAAYGIDWRWLRYHKSPSLPATTYDVLAGAQYGYRLVRDKEIQMVHARNHIPAAIALRLKHRLGPKIIFDLRGLMADEYVDAGHWKKNSMAYRITKAAERRALNAADGIVTLTENIWPTIQSWDALKDHKVHHKVIPCCADLDLFTFHQGDRDRRRGELKVGNRFLLIYSGSIDGWYLTEEMSDFFVQLQKQRNAHFLWLTQSGRERITTLMRARAINEDDYTILAAAPNEVPSYLSAADAGLAFIKPCFSKRASSPTKYAEYLGCGLPLIINKGVGDSDDLVLRECAGALISEFNDAEYGKAITIIEKQVRNREQTRQRSRDVAERLFDLKQVGIPRYACLYDRVLGDQFRSG